MIVVLDISDSRFEEHQIQPILIEKELLRDYYSDKEARFIEYPTEQGIWLGFDDEALNLKFEGNRLIRHSRVEFLSNCLSSRFWGSYNNFHLFKNSERKGSEGERSSPRFEFIHGKGLFEVLAEPQEKYYMEVLNDETARGHGLNDKPCDFGDEEENVSLLGCKALMTTWNDA